MNRIFKDQLGREIVFRFPPKRIVSLVPSQTEFLFDLGLDSEVVGVTKFCIHPEEKSRKATRVGGTKNLNIEKIISLQPDLIIANKEENEEAQIKELMHYPVWVSDVKNLQDALEMMEGVGEMVDKKISASAIIEQVRSAFRKLSSVVESNKNKRRNTAAYLIWRDPYIAAGGDTFINAMLRAAGFSNIMEHLSRYPEITLGELKNADPGYILLSSEPYPFREKHRDEIQEHLVNAEILLVDGEMFSWYGSRLLKSAEYFAALNSGI